MCNWRYTKTAINTSIFTGKTIGINCALYGAITKDIISFTHYTQEIGISNSEFILDKAIEIQKKVFERRKIEQKLFHKNILKSAFDVTKQARDMSLGL